MMFGMLIDWINNGRKGTIPASWTSRSRRSMPVLRANCRGAKAAAVQP